MLKLHDFCNRAGRSATRCAHGRWCRSTAPLLRQGFRCARRSRRPESLPRLHERRRHAGCLEARSARPLAAAPARSEEHTSELQSLMRISYAVFCLKKKKNLTRLTYDQNEMPEEEKDDKDEQTNKSTI